MYEGSQQSLSDMAARQAQAVDRLGRLRTGLITAVKRRFPRAVLDAEAGLGRRLREVDDEILLAQLDALLHSAPRRDSDLLERVRLAVERMGVVLPDVDPAAWVAALERLSVSGAELRDPSVGLAELFDGAGPAVAPRVGTAVTAAGAPRSPADELAALFGEDAAAGAPGVGEAVRAVPESAPESASVTATESTGATAGDVSATGATGVVSATPPGRSSAAPPPGAPDRPSLRPEVSASGRGGKRARPIRTQAAPPERQPLPLTPTDIVADADVAPQAAELDAATSQALLAAVCIPRPVFAADLIAVAGSMEAVRGWELQCRTENLPVRIVPAKMRHAARGSLIFPVDEARTLTTEFRRSLWGDVLAAKGPSYRGARLYELAVLLHRVGEQVVSHRLGEHTATLRLAQPGGLTGVVVMFGSDLGDESPVRAELLEQVGQLVGERLAGVAVLTTSGESGCYETLMEVLTVEARSRAWQPTMPVVAARSWEYADSRGSRATLVLGG
jgi:hypothetical protein